LPTRFADARNCADAFKTGNAIAHHDWTGSRSACIATRSCFGYRPRPAGADDVNTRARFNQSISYDAYDEYRIDLRVNLGVVRTN
jgi:hypothetical protein